MTGPGRHGGGPWCRWPLVAAAAAAVAVLLAACAVIPGPTETASTPGRPQLAAREAASMQVDDYLAQGPAPWRPPAAVARDAPADFTVALDGSGTHRSVQAAIDAVPARAQSDRRHVLRVKPGVYRETVCVQDKAPITLLGEAGDASAVQIVEGRYHALPKRPGLDAAHPCHPDLAAPHHGTPGSATMVVASDDFEAADLSIVNDAMAAVRDGQHYPPGAGESGGAQGVALTVQADRVLLDGLRLVGHQDTLQARRPHPATATRVLVRRSLIPRAPALRPRNPRPWARCAAACRAGRSRSPRETTRAGPSGNTSVARGGSSDPSASAHAVAPSAASASRTR